MRKNSYLISIVVTAFSGLTACSDFAALNTDPKTPVEVPANALFLAGEKNLADVYVSANLNAAPFRILSQVWTQTSNVGEARYNFTQYNAPGGWWKTIYTKVLSNLAEAKSLYAREKTTSAEVLKNKELITDVLEVYAFALLVNTYGDIPYSEALNRSIPFPKYDDARTVVNDLIARLDAAIAGLDVNAASFANVDNIYQGDVVKWKKFAASLKLKLALLLADTDSAFAAQKVREAIDAGLFTSGEDDAVFSYVADIEANTNPLRQYLLTGDAWKYFAPARILIDTLRYLNDPRLPKLFTPITGGGYAGADPAAGLSGSYSGLTSYWTAASAPSVLLDYSEVSFLLAEAAARNITGDNAETHYNNAITAVLTS
jgi:hypothetical protein